MIAPQLSSERTFCRVCTCLCGLLVDIAVMLGVRGIAKVDAGMRRGAVSIPHGHADANVNNLTSVSQVDALTGMALYGAFPVDVVPA